MMSKIYVSKYSCLFILEMLLFIKLFSPIFDLILFITISLSIYVVSILSLKDFHIAGTRGNAAKGITRNEKPGIFH